MSKRANMLQHGARWHRQQTLISVNPEGNTSTFTYGGAVPCKAAALRCLHVVSSKVLTSYGRADLLRDSKACTAMLRQQGVK